MDEKYSSVLITDLTNEIKRLVDDLKKVPIGMEKFSKGMRDLYGAKSFGSESSAAKKFKQLCDDTKKNALILAVMLPSCLMMLRSIFALFTEVRHQTFKAWSQNYDRYICQLKNSKKDARFVLHMQKDIITLFNETENKTKTFMNEIKNIQNQSNKHDKRYDRHKEGCYLRQHLPWFSNVARMALIGAFTNLLSYWVMGKGYHCNIPSEVVNIKQERLKILADEEQGADREQEKLCSQDELFETRCIPAPNLFLVSLTHLITFIVVERAFHGLSVLTSWISKKIWYRDSSQQPNTYYKKNSKQGVSHHLWKYVSYFTQFVKMPAIAVLAILITRWMYNNSHYYYSLAESLSSNGEDSDVKILKLCQVQELFRICCSQKPDLFVHYRLTCMGAITFCGISALQSWVLKASHLNSTSPEYEKMFDEIKYLEDNAESFLNGFRASTQFVFSIANKFTSSQSTQMVDEDLQACFEILKNNAFLVTSACKDIFAIIPIFESNMYAIGKTDIDQIFIDKWITRQKNQFNQMPATSVTLTRELEEMFSGIGH